MRRKLELVLVALLVMIGTGVGITKPAGGTVKGVATVKGGSGKGIVVYLEGVPGTPPKPKTATIRQREKQFEPSLTIVVKGTTIDFPNEDKIFHNVFSVSRPARFDLGLYKSGTAKSVEMKRAGVVDVYCNIHPEMIAKVKVLENAYYTITDDKGAFSIGDVPEGEYPVVAWLPSGDEAKGTVKVTAGKTSELKLEIASVTKANATHTRKDGTPYGRYK